MKTHFLNKATFENPVIKVDISGLDETDARRVVAVKAGLYDLPNDYIAVQYEDTVIIAAGLIVNGQRYGYGDLPDDFELYGV